MIHEAIENLRSRWYISLLVVSLLSIILGLEASQISFDIHFDQFLPDSRAVRARDSLYEYFPSDEHVHYVLVTESNPQDDVLSPDSIRIAYHLSLEISAIEGVKEVRSIPLHYDNALRYMELPGIDKASDSDIGNITFVFHRVLTEDDPEAFVAGVLGVDVNSAGSIVDDIHLAAEVFLSSEFRSSGKARSAIIQIILSPSYTDAERKELVKEIMDVSERTVDSSDDYLRGSSQGPSPVILDHTGEELALMQIDEDVSRSKYILSIVALTLVGTVLYLSFRRLSRVILPMVTLGIAVLWTFGTVRLLGFESSPLDLVSIPLVVGLGVDFSIHLLKRYDEEMGAPGDEKEERAAIKRSVKITSDRVTKALLITATTTVIAFLVNVTSEVRPVMYFGITCSIGIVYALLLTIFFLFPMTLTWDEWRPPLAFLQTLDGRGKGTRTPYVVGRTMKNLALWVTKYPVLVLLVVVLITTAALLTATNIEKEFSEDDFVSESLEARVIESRIERQFAASSMSKVYFVYRGEGTPRPDLIEDIAKKLLYIDDAPHMIRINDTVRTNSLFSVIHRAMEADGALAERFNFTRTPPHLPLDNCRKRDIEGLIDHLAKNETRSSLIGDRTYADDLERVYSASGDGDFSTVITVYVDTRSWEEANVVVQELMKGQEDTVGLRGEVTLTGWTVLVVETVNSMERSQVYGTGAALLLALIILFILYRSVRYSVVAVVPVLISATWILGTMSLLSIPLNILTITVTSLTIGLGVDYSIHIIERYKEESANHVPEKAMRRTLKYTGSSLSLSAFTTITGFLILLASPLPISRIFGLLTALAVGYSFVLSCLLVPVVLMKSIRKRVDS